MGRESNQELIVRLNEDIERGEGQDLEFIRGYPESARELAKEIAAFASSNPGTIYLGLDNDGNMVGISQSKDDIENRIAGLTRNTVKPFLRVSVDVIEINNNIIIKINVPKGAEPVYYVGGIPYIRNLTSSEPATPEQVKELHRVHFLSQFKIEEEASGEQLFLTDVLYQLSDFQILWFDHENRSVNPDLVQMRYDIDATGRELVKLSTTSEAKALHFDSDLEKLGDVFEELACHEFYIDGGASWRAFIESGNEAFSLTEALLERVKKRMGLTENQIRDINESISRNIKELRITWGKRELYRDSGELTRLKDTFRRLAYNFNRFANIPAQVEGFNFSMELKNIAKILRESSSNKYFMMGLGIDPLKKIESEIKKCLEISFLVSKQIEI